MSRVKTLLIFAYFIVGCADLMTTNIILSHGGGEANPFMALSQELLGTWWLIPKLCLTLLVLWLLSRSNKPSHIAFTVALFSTPVINNAVVIAGIG